jgi:Recombination endonuclease VII
MNRLEDAHLSCPPRRRGPYSKPIPTIRKCTKCKVVKPIEDFEKDTRLKHGYGYRCRICARLESRSASLRKFGITEDAYRSLLQAQGGGCAVCGGSDRKRLAVDHSHENGQIRGLLCRRCNTAIGLFADDSSLLYAAAEYVCK